MSTEPEPSKVVDLMAALEKSVGEAKAARLRHVVVPEPPVVAAPGSPEERHDG